MTRKKPATTVDDVFSDEGVTPEAVPALDDGWDEADSGEPVHSEAIQAILADAGVSRIADAPNPDVPAALPAVEGIERVLFDPSTGKTVTKAGPGIVSVALPVDKASAPSAIGESIILDGEVIGTPESITARALALHKISEQSLPELARTCLAIARLGIPAAYGYHKVDGLKGYLNDHLKGMSYRLFRYYVTNAAYAQEHGISDEVISELGWCKLAEISQIPSNRAPAMIEFALANTLEATKEACSFLKPKKAQGDLLENAGIDEKADEEGKPREFIHLSLEPEKKNFVEMAISAMQKITKQRSSEALASICVEWANSQGYEVPSDISRTALERRMIEIEKIYGVKLAVVEE